MQPQDKAYFEAMITLTAYPEWDMLVDELKKEVYQTQANALEGSKNWDQICFAKGWLAGLAYMINLRENNAQAYANAMTEDLAEADDAAL